MPPPARVAVISLHACPRARPGAADAGGMNVYVRETVRVMASRGVRVDVFTRAHLGADEDGVDWGPGGRLIHVPAGPLGAAKADLPAWLDTFVEGVLTHSRNESARYDAVVSHYWLSGLAALHLRDHWDALHVAGFHTLTLAKPAAFRDGSPGPRREQGEREVIAAAGALFAATEHDPEILIANYGAPAGRILQAPPGVDTRRFRPLPRNRCRNLLGVPESGQRLLFVGRTVPLKGIPVLFRALARLPEGVSASIVGGCLGDDEQRSLAEVAHRLGVGDRIRFEGSVPHKRLPLYFGAADVCVLPSHYESYGMAALEALACGRPVVASRVGGLEAVVDHGVNGWLVSPGSSEELSEALARLLGDSRQRQAFGRAGVAKARRCTWQRTTANLLGALDGNDVMTGRVQNLGAVAAGPR